MARSFDLVGRRETTQLGGGDVFNCTPGGDFLRRGLSSEHCKTVGGQVKEH